MAERGRDMCVRGRGRERKGERVAVRCVRCAVPSMRPSSKAEGWSPLRGSSPLLCERVR